FSATPVVGSHSRSASPGPIGPRTSSSRLRLSAETRSPVACGSSFATSPTRSLWDQHLETNQQRPKFSLNTYTYDSIADVLLPRAVGYSAGFLDYFFRGRLDVDLMPEGGDFGTVRLSGVNGSPEALGGGTLTLHAD